MTTACPHCARVLSITGFGSHAAVCAHRPGVRDLVQRLMRSDDPGCAVSKTEYDERADAYNATLGPDDLHAPLHGALESQLGNWLAACEWVGMERSRKVGGAARGVKFEVAAEGVEMDRRAARAVLEAELHGERGLAVCAVRKLSDGRTAYVLK